MTVIGTTADFSQRDPRWAADLLGFASWQTLGSYGCYVAAYANIAQANGKDVDVAQMNEKLKAKNLFSVDGVGEKSDISRNDALSIVYPDIKYVETRNWPTELADIDYFDVRSTTRTEIVVKIDYHPEKAGQQWHFCRVIGINDARNDVEIVDSYTGKRIWLSSLGAPAAKLIYQAVKFTGPGTDGGSGDTTNPPVVTQKVGIRINPQQWYVRTGPSTGYPIRSGVVLEGQTYTAEIVNGGWAKINFRAKTGFIGPRAYKEL